MAARSSRHPAGGHAWGGVSRQGPWLFMLATVGLAVLTACDLTVSPTGPRGRATPTPIGTLGPVVIEPSDGDTPGPDGRTTARPSPTRMRTATSVPTNTASPTITPGTP